MNFWSSNHHTNSGGPDNLFAPNGVPSSGDNMAAPTSNPGISLSFGGQLHNNNDHHDGYPPTTGQHPSQQQQQHYLPTNGYAPNQGTITATRSASSQPPQLQRHHTITTEQQLNQALIEFHEALNSISLPKKRDYLDAVQQVPHLVAAESNPMSFIRFSDFEFGAAAERMCNYWRERRALFQERALLPMTLDGNGALDPNDIQVLQAGYPAELPPTACGRQVMIFDPRRWIPSSNNSRLRALFYMANKLQTHVRAQTDRGVLYFVLVHPTFQPKAADVEFFQKRLLLLRKVFPIHFDANAVMMQGAAAAGGMPQQGLLAELFTQAHVSHGSYFRPEIHFETGPGDIQQIMMSKGMTMESIPHYFGGGCNMDQQVANWFYLQRMNEGANSPPPSLSLDQNSGGLSLGTTVSRQDPPQGDYHPFDDTAVTVTTNDVSSAGWDLDAFGDILDPNGLTEDSSPDPLSPLPLPQGGAIGQGSTAPVDQKPPPRNQQDHALEAFHQAMSSIPYKQKKEYLEALQQAPDLVSTESDPMKFIRYCKSDFWAAAARMCNYWRERRALFLEKAFLPMKLDGKGAMDESDILVLQAGFPAQLPNTKCGRAVGIFDRSKYLSSTSRTNRLKATFYFATKVTDYEGAQSEPGCVLINFLIQPTLQEMDPPFVEKTFYWVKEVIPVKVDPIVLIMLPKKMRGFIQSAQGLVSKQNFVANIISSYTSSFGSNFKGRVLFETNEGDIMNDLMKAGLTREGIPTSVGGDWMIEVGARKWIQDRVDRDCGEEAHWQELLARFTGQDQPSVSSTSSELENTAAVSFDQNMLVPVPLSEPLTEQDQALWSFQQAMTPIPFEEKKDYLEALHRVPELVSTESDPMKFIRYCKADSKAAAARMCSYWYERRLLFLEKAFLPMKLDGKGAMDEDDILVLQAGYPAQLPSTKCGRAVALFDRSKYLSSTTRTNRLKAVFYFSTKFSDYKEAQSDKGIIFLNFLIQPRLQETDAILTEKTFYWNTHTLPVRLDPFILIMLPKTMRGFIQSPQGLVTKQSFVADIISSYMSSFGSNFRGNICYETNEGDILKSLMKAGLTQEGIPTSAGGGWMVEEGSRKWVHDKVVQDCGGEAQLEELRKEEQRNAAALENSDEVRLKRRRTVNAIHSRKKRERRRKELDLLKMECGQLKETNASLKADHVKLETLLRKAHRLIGKTSG